jgi:ferritin-like metal-binding protein YciE
MAPIRIPRPLPSSSGASRSLFDKALAALCPDIRYDQMGRVARRVANPDHTNRERICMSWFSSLRLDSLQKLFLQKLTRCYDMEKRLVDALPAMRDASTDPDLRAGFDGHLRETRQQVLRLERVFERLDVTTERQTDAVMKALIAVGEEVISSTGDNAVKDAALIACASAVEQYEMAIYGSLRTWATYLGHNDIADWLQESLNEETAADKKLTVLAESGINAHANR